MGGASTKGCSQRSSDAARGTPITYKLAGLNEGLLSEEQRLVSKPRYRLLFPASTKGCSQRSSDRRVGTDEGGLESLNEGLLSEEQRRTHTGASQASTWVPQRRAALRGAATPLDVPNGTYQLAPQRRAALRGAATPALPPEDIDVFGPQRRAALRGAATCRPARSTSHWSSLNEGLLSEEQRPVGLGLVASIRRSLNEGLLSEEQRRGDHVEGG